MFKGGKPPSGAKPPSSKVALLEFQGRSQKAAGNDTHMTEHREKLHPIFLGGEPWEWASSYHSIQRQIFNTVS